MSWTHNLGTEQIMIHTCHSVELGRCRPVGGSVRTKKAHFTSKTMIACSCRLLPLALWWKMNFTTMNEGVPTINSSIRWLNTSFFHQQTPHICMRTHIGTRPLDRHGLMEFVVRRNFSHIVLVDAEHLHLIDLSSLQKLPSLDPTPHKCSRQESHLQSCRWLPRTPNTYHCVLLLSVGLVANQFLSWTFPTRTRTSLFNIIVESFFGRSELPMACVPLFPPLLCSSPRLHQCLANASFSGLFSFYHPRRTRGYDFTATPCQ